MGKLCFVELGSNEGSEQTVISAQKALRKHFPDAAFSRIRKTEPVDFASPRPFFNLSGRFTTPLSREEVTGILKSIEKEHGRKPEDKALGIVRLDIDLLIYDNALLKPKDVLRGYVRDGLAELA